VLIDVVGVPAFEGLRVEAEDLHAVVHHPRKAATDIDELVLAQLVAVGEE
jgi:hypothetical protein